MEIILKKDVQNVGFKDDVVSVKAGYGRNFLIPQGHAHLATPSAKKVLGQQGHAQSGANEMLVWQVGVCWIHAHPIERTDTAP